MSEIKRVKLSSLSHNPHRNTEKYPYDTDKLAALKRSMQDVGCWEGVIARKAGRGYEIAFGHHRVKAAAEAGLTSIPIILKNLSDEDMLKYMGRENGEDFRAVFLVLLETWDAAVRHNAAAAAQADVARFLGWTDGRGRSNNTARACESASMLIAEGHMSRSDLKGLSVKDARDVCGRAAVRMKQIEQMAAKTNRPREEVEKVKQDVAKGAKVTAENVRKGAIAQKDIRGEVDAESHRAGMKRKRVSPLFATFATSLINQIEKQYNDDSISKRLKDVIKSIPKIEMPEDKQSVEKIQLAVTQVQGRAARFEKDLDPKKVTPIRPKLKALKGGK